MRKTERRLSLILVTNKNKKNKEIKIENRKKEKAKKKKQASLAKKDWKLRIKKSYVEKIESKQRE